VLLAVLVQQAAFFNITSNVTNGVAENDSQNNTTVYLLAGTNFTGNLTETNPTNSPWYVRVLNAIGDLLTPAVHDDDSINESNETDQSPFEADFKPNISSVNPRSSRLDLFKSKSEEPTVGSTKSEANTPPAIMVSSDALRSTETPVLQSDVHVEKKSASPKPTNVFGVVLIVIVLTAIVLVLVKLVYRRLQRRRFFGQSVEAHRFENEAAMTADEVDQEAMVSLRF